MTTTTNPVTKDSIIGTILSEHPKGREVIQKYFGGGCFTCPGINIESLSFGSMMHNIDPEQIIKELNEED